jgi:hypothetical protein
MPSKEQNTIVESLWRTLPATRRTHEIHFLQRFETLTGIKLRSATVAAIPREFLGRMTEAPEEIARRYCYQLQVRTYNALRRHGTSSSRSPWTIGRLLEVRGFGLFALLDLLEVMAKTSSGNGE